MKFNKKLLFMAGWVIALMSMSAAACFPPPPPASTTSTTTTTTTTSTTTTTLPPVEVVYDGVDFRLGPYISAWGANGVVFYDEVNDVNVSVWDDLHVGTYVPVFYEDPFCEGDGYIDPFFVFDNAYIDPLGTDGYYKAMEATTFQASYRRSGYFDCVPDSGDTLDGYRAERITTHYGGGYEELLEWYIVQEPA